MILMFLVNPVTNGWLESLSSVVGGNFRRKDCIFSLMGF